MKHLGIRSGFGPLGFACVVAMALVVAAPGGAFANGPGNPNGNAGTAPSGAEQSALWTPGQAQDYSNKLAREQTMNMALGMPTIAPYRPAGLAPSRLAAAVSPAFPITGSVPDYNDPEPNSYYGYQCGPAAGHNALGAFGINYPIGTYGKSYPNADGLTQLMHTDTTNGTGRTYMPSALNAVDQRNNTYVWQNLGGSGDVAYYTTWDIWAYVSPIYNIRTYGYDPNTKSYRYPFSQYANSPAFNHYVAAYAYRSSGGFISISDSAYLYSHTLSQRYEHTNGDIWAAIYDIYEWGGSTLQPQILW